MARRCGGLMMMLLVLASCDLFAGPPRREPRPIVVPLSRQCNAVLPASAFQDDLDGVARRRATIRGAHRLRARSSSTCKYASSHRGRRPRRCPFTNSGSASNASSTSPSSPEQNRRPRPGGCYRDRDRPARCGKRAAGHEDPARRCAGASRTTHPSRHHFTRYAAPGIGEPRPNSATTAKKASAGVQVPNAPRDRRQPHGHVSLIGILRGAPPRVSSRACAQALVIRSAARPGTPATRAGRCT